MATEKTEPTPDEAIAEPHRVVIAMTGHGTFDEMAAVVDAVQDEAERRGLFEGFAMIDVMDMESARTLPEEHPMHQFLEDDD